MKWSAVCLLKRDFDAWAYSINWPQRKSHLPLLGSVSLTVEDIKFAYNAWCLLRLAMFFGTGHPKILSPLVNTTPSMDIMYGGNRCFTCMQKSGQAFRDTSQKWLSPPLILMHSQYKAFHGEKSFARRGKGAQAMRTVTVVWRLCLGWRMGCLRMLFHSVTTAFIYPNMDRLAPYR
ncbi:hypothetical protein C3747_78g136 [Trypanosoma cruzi]|uniref:Uncharacterized protein n=1 Tax=Trypanosoma cruzi TaxID=5693 RepID=A0A2V2WMQ3_TRYCR|nr:hypothetical protein C3747_78g136 [Trypanosoma cruzi]